MLHFLDKDSFSSVSIALKFSLSPAMLSADIKNSGFFISISAWAYSPLNLNFSMISALTSLLNALMV